MVKAKKQTKDFITLKTINVNAGLKAWYEKELVKLVNVMVKVYENKIISLYKSNKDQIKDIAMDDNIGSQSKIVLNKLNKAYSKYYDKKGKEASESMVKKTEKLLKTTLEASFYSIVSKLADKDNAESRVIKELFSQFSPEVLSNKEKFMKAFTVNKRLFYQVNNEVKKTIIMNNTELIKSIQQEYHKNISQQVYECIVNGRSETDLSEMIKVVGDKTKRRARLIAKDQVNKAHSVLYRQELKQNGITKAKWIHIGGGKTDRKTHITKAPKGLNNAIFDIKKGIYDPSVQKFIQPAELPFCRCSLIPIVEV